MAPPPLPPRAYEPEEPAAAAFAPVEEEFETPAERETDWKAERALRLHLPRVDEVAAGAVASRPPNPLAWMVRPEKPKPVAATGAATGRGIRIVAGAARKTKQPSPRVAKRSRTLREPPVETLHVAEMPAEPPEAEDLSGSLDAPEPAPQPRSPIRAGSMSLLMSWSQNSQPQPAPEPEIELAPEPEPEPALVPETEPEHELEPAPPAAAAEEAAAGTAPAEVIGHYEAHGAHYTMYADGSIDADTAHGVYRFRLDGRIEAVHRRDRK